jgi:hypothetical protein
MPALRLYTKQEKCGFIQGRPLSSPSLQSYFGQIQILVIKLLNFILFLFPLMIRSPHIFSRKLFYCTNSFQAAQAWRKISTTGALLTKYQSDILSIIYKFRKWPFVCKYREQLTTLVSEFWFSEFQKLDPMIATSPQDWRQYTLYIHAHTQNVKTLEELRPTENRRTVHRWS